MEGDTLNPGIKRANKKKKPKQQQNKHKPPSSLPPWRPDTLGKKKKKKKKKKKNSLAASHPSVIGQRPQERWIGAHWESQETPVAQLPFFRLRSALSVTDCRPGSSRIDSVCGGRTRDSIIGEATFRSQSASE